MNRAANAFETPNEPTIRHEPLPSFRQSAYPSARNTSRARSIVADKTVSTSGEPRIEAEAIASPMRRWYAS